MTETRFDVDRVEFFKGSDGLYYFRRVAANNKKVSSSEGYGGQADAFGEAEKLFGPDISWFEEVAENDWVEIDHPNVS